MPLGAEGTGGQYREYQSLIYIQGHTNHVHINTHNQTEVVSLTSDDRDGGIRTRSYCSGSSNATGVVISWSEPSDINSPPTACNATI